MAFTIVVRRKRHLEEWALSAIVDISLLDF